VVAASGTLLALALAGVLWAADAPAPRTLPLPSPPAVDLRGPTSQAAAEEGVGARPTPIRAVSTPAPARAASPTGRSGPRPAPARSTRTVSPAVVLTARYYLSSTWADGFVADITVRNPGPTAQGWEVRLAYPADFDLRVVNVWNATAQVSGATIVLVGGPLRPGAEVVAGFQAAKNLPAQANPISCSVNGAPC